MSPLYYHAPAATSWLSSVLLRLRSKLCSDCCTLPREELVIAVATTTVCTTTKNLQHISSTYGTGVLSLRQAVVEESDIIETVEEVDRAVPMTTSILKRPGVRHVQRAQNVVHIFARNNGVTSLVTRPITLMEDISELFYSKDDEIRFWSESVDHVQEYKKLKKKGVPAIDCLSAFPDSDPPTTTATAVLVDELRKAVIEEEWYDTFEESDPTKEEWHDAVETVNDNEEVDCGATFIAKRRYVKARRPCRRSKLSHNEEMESVLPFCKQSCIAESDHVLMTPCIQHRRFVKARRPCRSSKMGHNQEMELVRPLCKKSRIAESDHVPTLHCIQHRRIVKARRPCRSSKVSHNEEMESGRPLCEQSCISQVEAPTASLSCLIGNVHSTLPVSTISVTHSTSPDDDESLLLGVDLLLADSFLIDDDQSILPVSTISITHSALLDDDNSLLSGVDLLSNDSDNESLKFSYSDSNDESSDSEDDSDSDFYFSPAVSSSDSDKECLDYSSRSDSGAAVNEDLASLSVTFSGVPPPCPPRRSPRLAALTSCTTPIPVKDLQTSLDGRYWAMVDTATVAKGLKTQTPGRSTWKLRSYVRLHTAAAAPAPTKLSIP